VPRIFNNSMGSSQYIPYIQPYCDDWHSAEQDSTLWRIARMQTNPIFDAEERGQFKVLTCATYSTAYVMHQNNLKCGVNGRDWRTDRQHSPGVSGAPAGKPVCITVPPAAAAADTATGAPGGCVNDWPTISNTHLHLTHASYGPRVSLGEKNSWMKWPLA